MKPRTARPSAATLAAWAYVAAGTAAIAAAYALLSPTFIEWASSAAGLVAGPTIAAGVVLNRPRRPAAWLVLAGGILLLGVGDVAWSVLSPADVEAVEVASPADLAYVLGYGLLVVGLVGLTRRQSAEGELPVVVDVTIVSLGVGLLAWMALIEPVMTQSTGWVPTDLVPALYPILDVALVGVLVRVLLSSGRPSRAVHFLVVAILIFVVADIVYLRQTIDGTYVSGGPCDVGWFLGYVLWGAAALHPSSRFVGEVVQTDELPRFPIWRAAMLAAACLVAPLASVWAWSNGVASGLPMIAIVSAAMIVFWTVRVTLTVRRLRDALDERGTLQTQLREQAQRDPLVGLWNRSAFADGLDAALGAGKSVALLYVDLDDFKAINDALGQAAGDQALVEIASRIAGVLRPTDLAARLGGDEFGILLEASEIGLGETVAARILEALEPPIQVGGRPVSVRGSIGISFGDGRRRPEELMREADVAMYLAKGQGKARLQAFQSTMHQSVIRRIALRSQLENAIATRQFLLYFQPIVSTSRRSLVACEALVRWRHPERDLLLPGEFIDLAEETGLIVPLGRLVLEEACREARRWEDQVLAGVEDPAPAVSVNVSAVQLRHPSFVGDVAGILEETGLEPGRLILEVTESTLMDVDNASAIIGDLRAMRVRIAVDDFGTGYSSLSYLARYPIDIVKIDRAFVAALGTEAREERLTAAMINLSHDLRMQVIAEGVETEAQLERLAALGCGSIQGHLVAAAVPAQAAREIIREWRSRTRRDSDTPAAA